MNAGEEGDERNKRDEEGAGSVTIRMRMRKSVRGRRGKIGVRGKVEVV